MFSWLLYDTLLALPAAALAGLVRWRRGPARLEHGLWLAVLGLLLWPAWLLGGSHRSAGDAVALVSSGPPDLGARLVARLTASLGPDWSTMATRALVLVFAGVAAGLLVRELRRAAAVRRRLRAAREAPAAWRRRLERSARRVGVRAPRVVRSPAVEGPFLWTLGRPVLVLPDRGPAPEETVLLHELSHLRRRDHWSAWLELVALVFHFWNPLFWLARRRLRHAAELACDEHVVTLAPERRSAYAGALLDVVERAPVHGPLAHAAHAAHAAGPGADELEERLRRILEPRPPTGRARRHVHGLLVLVAALGPTLAAPSLGRFRAALPELPAGVDQATWTRALERAQVALRADPEDGAAHAKHGLALLGLGRPDQALRAFARQAELGFEVPKALYNQACAQARAGRRQLAIERLEAAERAGLDVGALARRDPDLASLRGESAFEHWR